ncbi:MAG TPA: hypothetical protein VGG28_14575 [Kofleriaceae bacterium]
MTDLAAAGVPLDRMRSWGELVTSGALARTLTRLCVVVADRLALGYRLTPSTLEISIDGVANAIVLPDPDRDVLGAVGDVLGQINEHLGDDQLLLVAGYRIVLADPRQVPTDRLAHMTPRITRGPLIERELAALPTIEMPLLGEDGSLAGLVAAYVERLARFAGDDNVHCEPRWTQDPNALTFTLSWRSPQGGGLQVTVRVPLRETANGPAIDPQPILDALNRFGAGFDDDEREAHLYRVATSADRVDIARLDRTTAAELRRRGELVEHPAQDVLRALADAGFELSWLGRDRTCHAFHQRELATRFGMLATSAGIALPAREARYVDAPLASIIAELNAGLTGSAHRVVAVVGEPFFYNTRLVLLDRAWCAYLPLLARTGNLEPGCITDADLAAIDIVLGEYPAAELPPAPPRLPALEELVRSENILGHDFKCSARPSDLGELIEELARFARLAVEVGRCTPTGDDFAFAVTCRGELATITLGNEKYANVGPILDYVNARIGARTPRHQLYLFRSGTWGGGVVRATDDEAAALRAAGYVA